MEEEEISDEELEKLYENCMINNCSNYMTYI